MGYQSDIDNNNGNTAINTVRYLTVGEDQLSPRIYCKEHNHYAIVGGNLVVPISMELRLYQGMGMVSEWVMNLPRPKHQLVSGMVPTMIFSQSGSKFEYAINNDGRVMLNGRFLEDSDALTFNFVPYVAEHPIVFDPERPS